MPGIWETTDFLSQFPLAEPDSPTVPTTPIPEDSYYDSEDDLHSLRFGSDPTSAHPFRGRPAPRCTDTHHHLKCGHTVRTNDPRCTRACRFPRWGSKRPRRRKCSACSDRNEEDWLLEILQSTDIMFQQLQDLRSDNYHMLPGATMARLEEFEEAYELRITDIRQRVRPELWDWYSRNGRAALEARVEATGKIIEQALRAASQERRRDREILEEAARAERTRRYQVERDARVRNEEAAAAERVRTLQARWDRNREEDRQATVAGYEALLREQSAGEEAVRQQQWDARQAEIQLAEPQATMHQMFERFDAEHGTESNPFEAETLISTRQALTISATVPTATAVRLFEENLDRLRRVSPNIRIPPRREPDPASTEWASDPAAVAEELHFAYQRSTQVHLLDTLCGGDRRILETLPLAYLAQIEDMLLMLQEPVTVLATIPTASAVVIFEHCLERLRRMHPEVRIPPRREPDPAQIEWAGDPAAVAEEMLFRYEDPVHRDLIKDLCGGDLRVIEALPLTCLAQLEEILEYI